MNIIERIEKGTTKLIVSKLSSDIPAYVKDQEQENELLRLAKLGQQMQWVNAYDRLPNKDNDVLVWTGATSVRACVGETPYGRAWYLVDKNCYLNWWNVTHWIPLPQPPKDGAEK